MTEFFFITYANNSLLDHPERIKAMLKAMKADVPLDSFGDGLSDAYDILADYYIRAEKQGREHLVVNYLEFHYRHPTEQLKKLLSGSEKWFDRNDDGTNTIVRDQLSFQRVLTEISEGRAYDEIEGLKHLLKASEYMIKESVHMEPFSIKEKLEWSGTMAFSLPLFLKIYSAYSLRKFLLKEKDRKRLKNCPYCEKFFHAKDAKRKICYEMKCKNEYHRKDMKNRRNDDPERYC